MLEINEIGAEARAKRGDEEKSPKGAPVRNTENAKEKMDNGI